MPGSKGSMRENLESTLDEQLYAPSPEEIIFFKTQTGINDEDDLKHHILSVQEQAYKIYPYPCIRLFTFIKPKISQVPGYEQILKLGRERFGAILIDVGCCFSVDLRRAVADGFPACNALGTDIHPEFWDLGHKIFKSSPKSFPASFIAGDVFNPSHLEVLPLVYEPVTTPAPELSSLTSLNPLHGHVSAIHASAFFHIFSEEQQRVAAKALASLLSPEPGSVICGSHVGNAEKFVEWRFGHDMFCHSPETWAALWDGEVFEKGTVHVDAELKEFDTTPENQVRAGAPRDHKFCLLVWSVTRL